MTQFTVPLTKENAAPAFALNLAKDEGFKVTLSWDGSFDADLHALICRNNGAGAKIGSWDDIFSTYNVKRMQNGQEVGYLSKNADGTFSTYGGALIHSADATDGQKDGIDEFIDIYPAKLPKDANGAIEIPLVAMIHGAVAQGQKFKNLQNVRVTVSKMDGTNLMDALLTADFGDYNGVQMGSLIIDATGTQFHPMGVGFDGDFNNVISHFAP